MAENLVLRACRRRAGEVRASMARGLDSLAAISSTAFFLGMLWTMRLIIGSFRGVDGERYTIYFATMSYLAQAMVPILPGLLVALMAVWAHRYFRARLEQVEVEMECGALALVNLLALSFEHQP